MGRWLGSRAGSLAATRPSQSYQILALCAILDEEQLSLSTWKWA